MAKELWRNTEEEPWSGGTRGHLGGTPEAPRWVPGSTQKGPGCTQVHPEGTRRRPGGSEANKEVFEAKCSKTILFYTQK